VVLGIRRIARVAGLVQGSLHQEIAYSVGGCRSADRGIALDEKRLAAGSREQCRRRQASETGAYDNDVVPFGHP
jgi:hypothetical protein